MKTAMVSCQATRHSPQDVVDLGEARKQHEWNTDDWLAAAVSVEYRVARCDEPSPYPRDQSTTRTTLTI